VRKIVQLAIVALSAFGQTSEPSFEVASVKLNTSGIRGWSVAPPKNGKYSATNVTLHMVIAQAYRVHEFQVVGGPGWIDSEYYDIVAKYAAGADSSKIHLMLQALLADRFQLSARRTKKEMPVYALTLARSGSKLKPARDPDCSASPVSPICGGFQIRQRSRVTGESVSMQQFCDVLGGLLSQPVLDETGIQGVVDLHTEWSPDGVSTISEAGQSVAMEGASIYAALQEQLGLKLTARKDLADQIVIDRVERPSGN